MQLHIKNYHYITTVGMHLEGSKVSKHEVQNTDFLHEELACKTSCLGDTDIFRLI